MGYRKLSTADIQELMRRWRAQEGVRQIARETGIDRKTVRRYIAAAKSFSIERDRAQDPSAEEIAQITQKVQARPARAPSEAWKQLMPYKDKIAACIDDQQRVRLRSIRALLAREGVNVTYWTLRRFAIRARMEQLQGKGTAAPAAEASA